MPETKQIPLSEIDIDYGWNSRSKANTVEIFAASETDPESSGLEGLMADILRNGQTTAVDVRPTTPPFYKRTSLPYSLVTGFRRSTALLNLFADEGLQAEAKKFKNPIETSGPSTGKSTHPNGIYRPIVPNLIDGYIAAVIHPPLSEREAFMMNARENANRETLTPTDRVMMVKKGLEVHGYTISELSLQLGKTMISVTMYARVAGLPITILNHWQNGGEFEGIMAVRRLSLEDMADLSKQPPHAQEAAYRKMLQDARAKKIAKITPNFERAKGRATHAGKMIARLQKDGIIAVLHENWATSIGILANINPDDFRGGELLTLQGAVKRGFDAEMQRATLSEESGFGKDIPPYTATERASSTTERTHPPTEHAHPPTERAPPLSGLEEIVVPQAGSTNGVG